jgi:hypothetical protein
MPSFKGKGKAVVRDDPGGTTAGVVLPLNLVDSGQYDVYALPLLPFPCINGSPRPLTARTRFPSA